LVYFLSPSVDALVVSEPEKRKSGFKHLPDSEQEICLRFGYARRSSNSTQAEIASALKISRNQIANIEARRVPLKFWLGERYCKLLGISQSWLAAGVAPQRSGLHPDVTRYDPQPQGDALFSDVYHRFIGRELSQLREQYAELEEQYASPPPRLWSEMLDYCTKIEALAKAIRSRVKSSEPEDNILLTGVAVSGKLAPVKSQLKSLLADLNRLTTEPGTKTKLADFLGAPLTSVSRWLSGEREPGGETTLQMLRWVQEQERQQNTLDSATNTIKGKTQVHKSGYEKQTQVRKKG
jgi:transcriptional regulator with XRE-family HTH domain